MYPIGLSSITKVFLFFSYFHLDVLVHSTSLFQDCWRLQYHLNSIIFHQNAIIQMLMYPRVPHHFTKGPFTIRLIFFDALNAASKTTTAGTSSTYIDSTIT